MGASPLSWSRVTSLFRRHRQRLARVLLVLAIVALGLSLWAEVPRQTELEFALGDAHAQVVELRVQYLREGESYHGARFDFPTGAPARVQHQVSLPSGSFEVQLDLIRRGDAPVRRSVHHLLTPTDGMVRIHVR